MSHFLMERGQHLESHKIYWAAFWWSGGALRLCLWRSLLSCKICKCKGQGMNTVEGTRESLANRPGEFHTKGQRGGENAHPS
jgi:hypothetical protein